MLGREIGLTDQNCAQEEQDPTDATEGQSRPPASAGIRSHLSVGYVQATPEEAPVIEIPPGATCVAVGHIDKNRESDEPHDEALIQH